MFWLYERPVEPTLRWIEREVREEPGRSRRPTPTTLKAGYNFGETAELFPATLPRAEGAARAGAATGTSPATRRLRSVSSRPRRSPRGPLFYGSYPITPASDILQELARFKNFGVKTFQAEDEIAAIGSAIGAVVRRLAGSDRHERARAGAEERGARDSPSWWSCRSSSR